MFDGLMNDALRLLTVFKQQKHNNDTKREKKKKKKKERA